MDTATSTAGPMVKYDSIDYFQTLAQTINEDAEMQKKVGSLKTTLLFVKKDRADAALLKFEGGKCTAENVPADSPAEFTFMASYDTWVSNHRDNIPLEKLIMTGKVKFKGSLPKIMMMKNTLTSLDMKAKTIPAEY